MSFLNSVLSSIGGDATKPITPVTKTAREAIDTNDSSRPVPDRNGQVLATTTAGLTMKRKAEYELSRPHDKLLKTEPTISRLITNGTPKRPLPSTRPKIQTSVPIPAGTYRGTSKPSPLTPTAPESKAPPKKGSYAEIMARGKFAQAIVPSVGAITHKPKEKLSTKKELLLQKKGLDPKSKTGVLAKSAPGSKSSSPGPHFQSQDKKVDGKKAPLTGYSGTAKPKPQTSYKGTMKPVSPSILTRKKHQGASDESDHSTTRRKPTPNKRRRDVYSDEDSQGEEEGYDSGSDLSDMEAGFSDVEEEDERAAREAKKEDEREQRILEETKVQKEARRRKLEELAKKGQRR